MKISREEVIKVASLAHLGLSPAEIELYREQLDAILTYIDKLKELDLTGVEPMAQVLYRGAQGVTDSHPELRADVLLTCDVASQVLAGASEARPPFFRVPRVIATGEAEGE